MKSLLFYATIVLTLTSCAGKQSAVTQSTRNNSIPVKVAAIDSVDMQHTVEASGLISTENESRLSFKIGGVIERILVDEGQQVRKGQLLASLNTTEIAAQVQQAQLAFDKAQRDYERVFNLYKDSVATLEQLQNSKTGLDVSRQILEQVMFNSKYASINAPADGFIVKKLLNNGEITAAGTPVLILGLLGNTSKWVLRVGVSDKDWAIIEKGNKAIITTDAFPGRSFSAIVSKKTFAADIASGSFEIEMLLEVKGLKPAVGMFGKAVITPSKATKGFSIPYEALLEANGQKGFLFVTNDQKTVKRVEVNIASIDNNRVVISDGLNDYSFVIISGSPYLKEGAIITITK